MEFRFMKFFIFIAYTISSMKQYRIVIGKISNMGLAYANFDHSHAVFEFDCTPYFEDDDRKIYLQFNKGWQNLELYIFYDKKRINLETANKNPGIGYDLHIKSINADKIYLNPKQNIGYLVLTCFNDVLTGFNVHYINLNGYYNLSSFTKYSFTFPLSEFNLTFSYQKNHSKANLLSFEFSTGGSFTHTITLYNKNKTQLKVTKYFFGGFSFNKFTDIDEFLIKIEVNKSQKHIINFLMEDYPNLVCLSQKNNTVKFDLTKYSPYIFLINSSTTYENSVEFFSNIEENSNIYYELTALKDIEDIKSEFLYKFGPHPGVFDRHVETKNGQFSIPLDNNRRQIVFRMFPGLFKKNKYIRAVFYSSKEINTSTNYYFPLTTSKPYYIFNYTQKYHFNNSLNGFISVHLPLVDNYNDISMYTYYDPNDINIEEIKNKNGNLNGKNWKSISYTKGEIYFLIANFKTSYDYQLFYLENNNEYFNISKDFNSNSKYSIYMQFNNTRNQHLTFSITPKYYYYVYINITPIDLKSSISALTSNYDIITPVDNKYYFVKSIDNIYFKIFLSSDNDFNNFNINIGKLDELPNENDKIIAKTYYVLVIIIIGALQLLMFIIYMIKLKFESKKQNILPIRNQELIDAIDE